MKCALTLYYNNRHGTPEINTYIRTYIHTYAKQKHLGYKKSARPIRSSIANKYVGATKRFVSVETKKSPMKDVLNYLNDIQEYFHKYDWLCHLATFFIPNVAK